MSHLTNLNLFHTADARAQSRTRSQSRPFDAASHARSGIITVLAAFLMVMMLGMVAFAVDVGYMMVTQTQLQAAADSAAMAAAANMSSTQSTMTAAAQQYAAYHKAAGAPVSLASSDVLYGTWNSTARTFTSSGTTSNAVKVTVRRDNSTGANGTFFGRIFGLTSFNIPVSAIAIGNPRDICFVVDLSGSMNDDTVTGYGSSASYRSSGYTSDYQTMMQQVFTDFNFGTYPGTTQKPGSPLGSSVSWSGSGSNGLYSKSGPLSKSSISTTYRITSSDSTSSAQTKAYKWMIDNQVASIMPNAKPTPLSSNSASYNYWQSYLSYITANSSYVVGYRSYVSWLMDEGGRDQTVDSNGDYGELSTKSPNCPYHSETVGSSSFSFPPREYPTHSERRSVIAGIQEVQKFNSQITDPNQMDWVSIVTFDKVGGVRTLVPLTSTYTTAMTSAASMQAVGENGASTDTEEGLVTAYNLIKPASQGGTGRENTQKVVILLTDGVANLKDSSNSTVAAYEAANPNTYNGSSNYYGDSSDYPSDAALMTAAAMQAGVPDSSMTSGNSSPMLVYALALGLAADYDFMDRMARIGGTADSNGQAPRTDGDPNDYETQMTALLDNIIDNPEVHLVQ
ncbi:MAG TPA: TadG family pilus assembly protein [Pirellulales bacterium]|nr:TadG family pilus assembly protein [Pirellulales bacterium]